MPASLPEVLKGVGCACVRPYELVCVRCERLRLYYVSKKIYKYFIEFEKLHPFLYHLLEHKINSNLSAGVNVTFCQQDLMHHVLTQTINRPLII